MKNLYGEDLAKLYQSAPHRSTVEHATFSCTTTSPSCGDQVTFSGIITNNIIVTIGFIGTGSMLSQIFAELLCQKIEQQPIAILNALSEEDVKTLLPLELGPNRLEPLTMMLVALQKHLAHNA